MTTPRLGAPELVTSQTNKEETVNEQIRYIESGAGHFIFKDRDLTAPPGSPADGDCYLVLATGTGAWAGHDGDIAFYLNTAWVFINAIEGFTAWVNDENVFIGYDGAAWNTLSSPSGVYQPLDGELTAIAGLTSANNKIPYFTGSGTAALLTRDTDGTLAGNSDTNIATQKAVKTYVDAQVAGTGTIGGSVGSTDNRLVRSDGTGGSTLQSTGITVDDNDKISMVGGADLTPASTPSTTSVGYLGAPQNLGLDSGNVALALTDCGKSIDHTDGNARDLTIPANGSVAFPIGTIICGSNEGSGIVTMKITTDTLRWGSNTGQRSIAQHGSWTIRKVTSTVWRLTGDGIT